jgi:hypothetical protein
MINDESRPFLVVKEALVYDPQNSKSQYYAGSFNPVLNLAVSLTLPYEFLEADRITISDG